MAGGPKSENTLTPISQTDVDFLNNNKFENHLARPPHLTEVAQNSRCALKAQGDARIVYHILDVVMAI
jgi:hypothetical protein